MENLKIGDKVYKTVDSRWNKYTYYTLAEVVRLTKTQAVLDNGTKIVNELCNDWHKNKCFKEYGDRYSNWYIQTEEILQKAKLEKERIFINNWFEKTEFTDDEKRKIYLTLKKQ